MVLICVYYLRKFKNLCRMIGYIIMLVDRLLIWCYIRNFFFGVFIIVYWFEIKWKKMYYKIYCICIGKIVGGYFIIVII